MKYIPKIVVTIILVISYCFLTQYGYYSGEISINNILYPFSHANIWHLLANVVCLWMIPCELHLLTSFLLAVLCSILPCFLPEATVGFSGVLFAIVGISWGRVNRFRDMIWKNKWFLIIPFFIPHINAFIHVYCLLSGYLVGRYVRLPKNDWL